MKSVVGISTFAVTEILAKFYTTVRTNFQAILHPSSGPAARYFLALSFGELNFGNSHKREFKKVRAGCQK